MRLIISVVIIISILSSSIVARERTLNGLYNLMLFVFESKGDDPRINPFKNTDQECLKRKLKLPEYSEKVVDEDLGLIIATAGSYLCSKDQNAAFDASLNQILSDTPTINNIECYKRRLLELEPTSIVVKNFNADPSIACKSPLFEPDVIRSIHDVRLKVFKRINLLKCVNSDLKETELTELKESILKAMSVENGGISEDIKQGIFEEMRKEYEDIYDCCVKEMENRFI